MAKLTILHNPRCSKSREALKLIKDNNCEHSIVLYLEANLKKSDIKNVIRILMVTIGLMLYFILLRNHLKYYQNI